MADFDWYGTCVAIHKEGHVTAVLAAGSDGTVYSSYPLAEDGNYTFWAYSDAYKGMVNKDDGSEAEEDIYEAYNLGLLASGRKSEIPPGHGIRINGSKFTQVQELTGEKYKTKIENAEGGHDEHFVTIEKIYVCKGKGEGLAVCIKQGYVIVVKWAVGQSAQAGQLEAIQSACIGFYWACGPDPVE